MVWGGGKRELALSIVCCLFLYFSTNSLDFVEILVTFAV